MLSKSERVNEISRYADAEAVYAAAVAMKVGR